MNDEMFETDAFEGDFELLTDQGRRFVAKTKRVAEYAQLQPV